MTTELFRTLGFEVLSANSGARALEMLNQNPGISLLFSDVVMEGMSGVELAKAATAAFPRLKVILASGHAGSDIATPAGGKLDSFQFLSKPYRVNDVVRKLRAIG